MRPIPPDDELRTLKSSLLVNASELDPRSIIREKPLASVAVAAVGGALAGSGVVRHHDIIASSARLLSRSVVPAMTLLARRFAKAWATKPDAPVASVHGTGHERN